MDSMMEHLMDQKTEVKMANPMEYRMGYQMEDRSASMTVVKMVSLMDSMKAYPMGSKKELDLAQLKEKH